MGGIDVDGSLPRKLVKAELTENLSFEKGGAESLRFAEGGFDGVAMFKSLHQVPGTSMVSALTQIHRILKTGRTLFVSEPIYAGPFNDLMKIFHEGEVRVAAIKAVDGAFARRLFELDCHVDFFSPVPFRNFEDFRARMMYVTHNAFVFTQAFFNSFAWPTNRTKRSTAATLIRPMRKNVLIKIEEA